MPKFALVLNSPDMVYWDGLVSNLIAAFVNSNQKSILTNFIVIEPPKLDKRYTRAKEFFKRYTQTIQSVVGLDEVLYFATAEQKNDLIERLNPIWYVYADETSLYKNWDLELSRMIDDPSANLFHAGAMEVSKNGERVCILSAVPASSEDKPYITIEIGDKYEEGADHE